MRKRYLAVALATFAATPLLVSHQPVYAATAVSCAGSHTWNMPNNGTAFVYSATMSESWNRSCATVNTAGLPFAAVTVLPDIAGPASSSFAGDCAFGFSNGVGGGIRFFVGAVAVGTGVQGGTATASSAGVLGVPSVIPCSGGTITWNGVEDFTATS
jgi:hypothetical protein